MNRSQEEDRARWRELGARPEIKAPEPESWKEQGDGRHKKPITLPVIDWNRGKEPRS